MTPDFNQPDFSTPDDFPHAAQVCEAIAATPGTGRS